LRTAPSSVRPSAFAHSKLSQPTSGFESDKNEDATSDLFKGGDPTGPVTSLTVTMFGASIRSTGDPTAASHCGRRLIGEATPGSAPRLMVQTIKLQAGVNAGLSCCPF
jgi:hypothetical protein